MTISREYLLDLIGTQTNSAKFYAECLIGDIKLDAQEGKTTYMSQAFPIQTAELCRGILYELCLRLPDTHIFTMRDARSTDTYIVLDWTTEYVYMYHKD